MQLSQTKTTFYKLEIYVKLIRIHEMDSGNFSRDEAEFLKTRKCSRLFGSMELIFQAF